jgi:hypothetical protein
MVVSRGPHRSGLNYHRLCSTPWAHHLVVSGTNSCLGEESLSWRARGPIF